MKWIFLIVVTITAQLSGLRPAFAFDRMVCDSNLGDWTIHNSVSSNKAVIDNINTSVRLSKAESITLMIRDEQKNEIGFISPWNEIQFHKAKKSSHKTLAFDFKTDKETWFTLSMKDSAKKITRSLSCKMTF